jgi:hypothetical protein
MALTAGVASAQLGGPYPPDPVRPTRVEECTDLSRAYGRVRSDLERAHTALGLGRGAQVDAGPCCKEQEAPGSGWCRTFQSHAAAWEAIHCCDRARRDAVRRCLDRVRVNRTPAEGVLEGLALAKEGEFEAALKALQITRNIDVFTAWTRIGNDPDQMVTLTTVTAQQLAQYGIKDPVVSAFVNHSLELIQTTHESALQTLGRVSEDADRIVATARQPRGPSTPARPAPVTSGGLQVLMCKERRGAPPVCQPSPVPRATLEASGAECKEEGGNVLCF